MPAEAKVSSPLRVFASAIKSFTERTGNEGCTARMLGAVVICEIGAKSFTTSYGNFLNNTVFTVLGTPPTSKV